jgi:hypothetical protein
MTLSFKVEKIYEHKLAEFVLHICNEIEHKELNAVQYFSVTDEENNIYFKYHIPHNTKIDFEYKKNKYSIFYKKEYIEGDYDMEIEIECASKQDFELLICDSVKKINSNLDDNDKLQIYYYTTKNIVCYRNKVDIESIALDSIFKNNLLKDIEYFYSSRDLYNKLKIPYQKVYLLHGDTQNTLELAISFASNFNKNLCVYDYENMDNIFSTIYNSNNNIYVINNIYDNDDDYINNGFACRFYNLSGCVFFLNVDNIKKVPKSIIKFCDNIISVKHLSNHQEKAKQLYIDITGKSMEEANDFYRKIKDIKFDIQTLRQYLLKPQQQQTVQELERLVNAKHIVNNNLYI